MVFVSSKEQIKELDSAPDSVLSLNGAAKHVRGSNPLHADVMLMSYRRCSNHSIQ